MFNCTCLIDFIFLKRWLINKPSSVQHSSCILRFLLKKLFFEKLKIEMSAEFGGKAACPPLGLCKKLIWFGKQTEAQSYNQLQRCLRHWTLLELKWPVQDVGFVVPASCLVKVTHKKLWETTVNGGEEEYGCFYLTYVWISLIWSKNDIFSSESRHFSWLLQVEVCILFATCQFAVTDCSAVAEDWNKEMFMNLKIWECWFYFWLVEKVVPVSSANDKVLTELISLQSK